MRNIPARERALRLALTRPQSLHICRSCLLQSTRHATTRAAGGTKKTFFQRMRDSLFGSKEAKQAEESREKAQKKQVANLNSESVIKKVKKIDEHGREYDVAAVVNPARRRGYVPASTWEGLEKVGSETWARAKADKGEKYTGFGLKKLSLSDDSWAKLLHHVTVEVLTLRQANRDVFNVCHDRQKETFESTDKATIFVRDGSFGLDYGSSSAEDVLRSIPRKPETGLTQQESPKQRLYKTFGLRDSNSDKGKATRVKDLSWMSFELPDVRAKAAIFTRCMQITGHRCSDVVMAHSKTLSDIYYAVKAKERPTKLFSQPSVQKLTAKLNNVQVFPTRRTPVHKETSLGRWKLIEQELLARQLPVFGTTYRKAREGM